MAETHHWSTWPPAPRIDDRYATARRVRWSDRRPRVIVAHASHHVRWFLAAALRLDDHHVACVKSWPELSSRLSQWTIAGRPADLVLCGPRLHGISAAELIDGLHDSDFDARVVGILGPHDAALATELDRAHAVFAWPFDADDVRTAVLNLARWGAAA